MKKYLSVLLIIALIALSACAAPVSVESSEEALAAKYQEGYDAGFAAAKEQFEPTPKPTVAQEAVPTAKPGAKTKQLAVPTPSPLPDNLVEYTFAGITYALPRLWEDRSTDTSSLQSYRLPSYYDDDTVFFQLQNFSSYNDQAAYMTAEQAASAAIRTLQRAESYVDFAARENHNDASIPYSSGTGTYFTNGELEYYVDIYVFVLNDSLFCAYAFGRSEDATKRIKLLDEFYNSLKV